MIVSSENEVAIGVIAGRGGSIRLPGKNVMLVGGKPLIVHTIAAALQAKKLARVIVSTDDDEIASVAIESGAEVIVRPADLAQINSPIDDAYRHVLKHLEESEGFTPGIVVGMQANIPVRKNGEIDLIVDKLRAANWASSVATGRRVFDRPEWMKRIQDPTTDEISAYMDAGTGFRKQDLTELFILDGAAIALRRNTLLAAAGDRRVHSYLGNRVLIHIHDLRFSMEIDEPDDIELAEFFLSRVDNRSVKA